MDLLSPILSSANRNYGWTRRADCPPYLVPDGVEVFYFVISQLMYFASKDNYGKSRWTPTATVAARLWQE